MNLTLKNEFLTVEFSTLGGEIRSIKSNKTDFEYLWQGSPQYWTGRATNLFPIVGRVKEGKYKFKGEEYTINSPHGFLKISEMDVSEHTENTLVFNLKSSEETLKSYPFEFDFYINYQLDGGKLSCRYYVMNNSLEEMYFSVGGHPGFNVPFEDDEKFTDYYLEFNGDCHPNEVVCDNCFITGQFTPYKLEDDRIIRLNHNLFDNDAIILSSMDSRVISLKKVGSDRSVTVDFTDFAYLGLWHKPLSDAPYICIEPWNGLPSGVKDNEELTKKPAILKLQPDETYSAGFSIDIAE